MADDTDSAQVNGTKRGYTPPKGRPTRARDDTGRRLRAFGPVAQWITFAIALIVVIVVIVMITGGGDFNPLNDDGSLGAPAAADVGSAPGHR